MAQWQTRLSIWNSLGTTIKQSHQAREGELLHFPPRRPLPMRILTHHILRHSFRINADAPVPNGLKRQLMRAWLCFKCKFGRLPSAYGITRFLGWKNREQRGRNLTWLEYVMLKCSCSRTHSVGRHQVTAFPSSTSTNRTRSAPKNKDHVLQPVVVTLVEVLVVEVLAASSIVHRTLLSSFSRFVP